MQISPQDPAAIELVLKNRVIDHFKAGVEAEADRQDPFKMVHVHAVVAYEEKHTHDERSDAKFQGTIGIQYRERPRTSRRENRVRQDARCQQKKYSGHQGPDSRIPCQRPPGNLDYGQPADTNHQALTGPADPIGSLAVFAKIEIGGDENPTLKDNQDDVPEKRGMSDVALLAHKIHEKEHF